MVKVNIQTSKLGHLDDFVRIYRAKKSVLEKWVFLRKFLLHGCSASFFIASCLNFRVSSKYLPAYIDATCQNSVFLRLEIVHVKSDKSMTNTNFVNTITQDSPEKRLIQKLFFV